MKKILLFAVVLMLLFISYPNLLKAQSAGFNTTFIIINNGASDTYYDLQAATGNPDFNGANLGTFCFGASNALIFKGAEHNVYKCGSCDLTSTRVYYRIYPTPSPSGSFVSNNIPYFSGFANGCGGQDQQWKKTDYSTDLLFGLAAGNYTMEVYSDASTTCFGTIYAGNSGANYKATFVVRPVFTAGEISSTGQTICSGGDPSEINSIAVANGGDNVITYKWQANGTDIPEATSATYDPPANLTVNTTYTRFAHDGTCNTSFTLSTGSWVVTVYSGIPSSVSAVANPNSLCAGATLTLTGTATDATSWSWTGPNDFASPDQNPQIANVTSAASGVYSLIASNVCGAAEAVTTASVTVFSGIPTSVSASASPNPICAGATLTLAGTAAGATSWSWTGPNGYNSSVQSPTITNVTVQNGGDVYVLTASNACGAATPVSTAVVTVNTPVTSSVSIVASANPVVSGTTVEFTATPVNGGTPSYAWYLDGDLQELFITSTFSTNPIQGTQVYVIMTSSLPCTSPVQSDIITMTVTTAPATSTWDGSTDSDWHTAANWSNGVPGGTTNVTIPFTGITNFPTISIAAVCHNITLKSGASILGNNKLSVTGDASVERLFTGNEWHLLSSPITNANTGMFTGKYLQYHNETNNKYYDILSADSVITVAKGYAVWGGSGFTKAFVGPLNDNNKSYPVKKAGLGWNLVGNPYPSYIDWNASGWTKTNVLGTTYRHVSNNATTGWATYNGTTGTNGGTRYIAPCQGFFVEASANGTLGMSNAVRTHETAPFYKSSEDVVPNLIRLEISGNGFKDDAVVYFTPTATTEFDGESDARKLFGDVAEAPQIYSFGPTPLAINTLRELASVPVGIHADTNGTFTIAATEINDLKYVTLEDTKTGIFTELANKSYTFDFIAGENEQRFKLHFSSVGIDEKETTTANIYSYQQTVYVNLADNTQGDINIYNLAGQLVTAKESASGNVRIGLNSMGVYMVKVVTEKETLTQKVVIR